MYAAWVLALLASMSLTVGLYLMKREAEHLPSLAGGWRVAAWVAFVRDPWWLVGLALQIVGYGLYMVALRSAPLSIVHATLNGGIALFVVFAVFGLGERVRPVEWLGVFIIIAALLALGASFSSVPEAGPVAHNLLPFSLTLLALSALAMVVDRAPGAVGLSVASGLTLGLGSVYTKGLASAPSLTAAVASIDLPLTVAANLVGFVLMQAALQAGRGVVVMPLFAALSNLVPIIGGIVLFDESLPTHGAAAVLRPLAFALAILGAVLLAGSGGRPEPQSANPIRRTGGSSSTCAQDRHGTALP